MLGRALVDAAGYWAARRGPSLTYFVVANLTLNLTLSVLHLYVPHRIVVAVMIAMEAAIFVTEGLLVRSLIRRCRHPFLLSLTMNAVSLLAGFLIKI